MAHYSTFNMYKTQKQIDTSLENTQDATFVPTKFNLFGCAALVAIVPAIQNLVGQDGDFRVLVNLTT
jgi:hypothetical protein